MGRYEFAAHEESNEAPNLGQVYSRHEARAYFKIKKTETLHAAAYCNIHGLWESFKDIHVA